MTFGDSGLNLLQIAATLGWLKQLYDILCSESGNPNDRWDNLQKWLARNPDKQKLVDAVAAAPSAEATNYLLQFVDLDGEQLRQYDPMGLFSSKIDNAVSELQKLYRERKLFDKEDGRKIDSPGKKRKRKAIRQDNAFQAMNDVIDIEVIK